VLFECAKSKFPELTGIIVVRESVGMGEVGGVAIEFISTGGDPNLRCECRLGGVGYGKVYLVLSSFFLANCTIG